MKIVNKKNAFVVLTVALSLGLAGIISAATAVNLSTADNFAVLAGSGITNTGSSVINGDIGSLPPPRLSRQVRATSFSQMASRPAMSFGKLAVPQHLERTPHLRETFSL